MRTINGVGTMLYGKRDTHAATMTSTVTLNVVFFFVPLLPIATYRVVAMTDGYYSFLAKRWPEKRDWMRAVWVWLFIFAVFGAGHFFLD